MSLTKKYDLKAENVYIKGKFFSFDNLNAVPRGEKFYCIDIHNHVDMEIIYMKSGRMYLSVNQTQFELESGDIAIFNPYDIHEAYFLYSEPLVEYYYLRIDLSAFITSRIYNINQLLYNIENQLIQFPNVVPVGHQQNDALKTHFEAIFDSYTNTCISNDIDNEAKLCSDIISILPVLSSLVETYNTSSLGAKEIKFIKDITKYLSRHYSEDISVTDMCKALSYSKSNLYRMFEACFNESPSVYLRNYRVLRAAIEYRYSDMSIADIAMSVGFSDYCYFSKSFKSKMGISPKKFFQKFNQKI